MWQPINRRGLGGGVLLVLLTSPSSAQYGCSVSAAVTIPTHCTREKKKTALQRVRFSHFFLRIRDRQNRYRIGRRIPGYSLTLCCRTATKTGKGWERERWFLEIPYGDRLAHRWGDRYLYYDHNRSSLCGGPCAIFSWMWNETSFYLGYYLEIAEGLAVS